MTRSRLWIASELYYPEETSTGYFLTRIAEGLAREFDVRIISGRPSYSARDTPVIPREERHGTTIYRMLASRFPPDRLMLRTVNLVSFTVLAFFFSMFHFRRGDLILVVTNPPTLPVAIIAAAKIRGAQSVLLVHDVYPEVLAATKMLAVQGLPYRMLAELSGWLARRFDRVVVLGRDMRDVIAAKMRARADRIVIIPNWGDVELVTPVERDNNRLRHELGLDGKFIVQFSGNAGRTHDLDSLFDAAGALRLRTDIHFLLVGFGGKFAMAESVITSRHLTNVTMLPRQPRDRLATMLTCSNLTVIAFVRGMCGISVPSRMYNLLAAGVPIAAIADPQSELALVVTEGAAGWVIADGDLATLVATLADAPGDEARRRGDSGRALAERDYPEAAIILRYAAMLNALASGAEPASSDPATPPDCG